MATGPLFQLLTSQRLVTGTNEDIFYIRVRRADPFATSAIPDITIPHPPELWSLGFVFYTLLYVTHSSIC